MFAIGHVNEKTVYVITGMTVLRGQDCVHCDSIKLKLKVMIKLLVPMSECKTEAREAEMINECNLSKCCCINLSSSKRLS